MTEKYVNLQIVLWFTQTSIKTISKCTKCHEFHVNKKINLRARQIPAGKKLQKSDAVQETDNPFHEAETISSEFDEAESQGLVQRPSATYWEELQDIYFVKRFKRAQNASQESLMDDEDECKINLTKLYHENSAEKSSSTPRELSQDAADLIDDLIKSFEDEFGETDAKTEENESAMNETPATNLD